MWWHQNFTFAYCELSAPPIVWKAPSQPMMLLTYVTDVTYLCYKVFHLMLGGSNMPPRTRTSAAKRGNTQKKQNTDSAGIFRWRCGVWQMLLGLISDLIKGSDKRLFTLRSGTWLSPLLPSDRLWHSPVCRLPGLFGRTGRDWELGTRAAGWRAPLRNRSQ